MMFHSTHSEQGITQRGRALKGAFWLGIVLMFGVMGSARADQPGPELVLSAENGDLKVGPGMNASGRDLAGCRFVVQDLRGANFDNANLDGAVLWDCKLQGASFRGAFLTGLRTEDCEFADADFTDATINGVLGVHTDLELGYRLDADQLKSTRSYRSKNLSHCSVSAAIPRWDMVFAHDFRDMDLRGALLAQGDFSHSRFDNARVDGMRLGHAASCSFEVLSKSQEFNRHPIRLTGVRLEGKLLGDWELSQTIIEDSALYPATGRIELTNSRLIECTLTWLTSDDIISSQNYREQDFSHTSFRRCDLENCSFRGFNLEDTFFNDTNLTGVDFSDAVITGSRFWVDAPAAVVEQLKQTWNYKNNQMESVDLRGILAPGGHWNWETDQLEVR